MILHFLQRLLSIYIRQSLDFSICLFIYLIYGLPDSILFHEHSVIKMTCLDAQIVPDLASETPFNLAPVSFWQAPLFLKDLLLA